MKGMIFTFKISINNKIHRIIEIKGNKSLYNFAEVILQSFDFDLDHSFGFYDNYKNIHKSNEVYELFADMPEGAVHAGAKGVEREKICDVFELKKKMAFLFDYGDEWIFLVECKKLSEPLSAVKYPRIIEKIGASPEQYPDYDDKEYG